MKRVPLILFSNMLKIRQGKRSLKNELIRGALGGAGVQVVNRLLALALGVVLARGLGVDGYGIYSYILAIMIVLVVVADLGMSTLVLRQFAAYHSQCHWGLMRGLLVRSIQLVFLISIVLVVLALFIVEDISSQALRIAGDLVIWALVLFPLLTFTKLIASMLQGLQHVVKAQTIEGLIRPIFVLSGVSGVFYIYPAMRLPHYVVVIQVVCAVGVLLLAMTLLRQYLPKKVYTAKSEYHSRQWLMSALPLTIIGGVGVLNSQTDILMLGFFTSPEEVGIYSVAVQGSALVAFGLHAANAVIAPQLSRLYVQADYARLQRLVTYSARAVLLTALPIALAFCLIGGKVAGWVFGPEFTASQTPMAILAVGQLVNAAMGSVGFLLNMTGHEKDVARTLVFATGLNILLNYFLIPQYGVNGAAVATAISIVIWNIVLCRLVKQRIGINSTVFNLIGFKVQN